MYGFGPSLRQQVMHKTHHRPAFTLVEMLVVIVIIGILAALLVPAVFRAMNAAKEARIGLEVANLAAAMERFKVEYGSYPPCFTLDYSTGKSISPTNQLQKATAIKAQISKFMNANFRYRDAKNDVIVMSGQPDNLAMSGLDSAEALYFWLGGNALPANPNPEFANIVPYRGGLGKNPTFPLKDVTADRTPYFEFDQTRLWDRDGDGFLEYYPAGDSNKTPYVYFEADQYRYAYFGDQFSNESQMAVKPYTSWQGTQAQLSTQIPTGGNIVELLPQELFAASEKFQIISAGLDSTFASSKQDVQSNLVNYILSYSFPNGPYVDPNNAFHDNITNFSEGTLEDQLP